MSKHAIQYALGGGRIIPLGTRWFVITPQSGAWLYEKVHARPTGGVHKSVGNVPPGKGIQSHAQMDPELVHVPHNDLAWFEEYVGHMYPDQLRYVYDGRHEQWRFQSSNGRVVFLAQRWLDDKPIVIDTVRSGYRKVESSDDPF